MSDCSCNCIEIECIEDPSIEVQTPIRDYLYIEEDIQVTTMPEASDLNFGKVVQYVGETDENYIKGYFYECKLVDNEYTWVQIATQPASTVTLNGTPTQNAEFYAPIDSGENGQVLKSAGTGNAPAWGSLNASDVGALADSTKYGASLSVNGRSVQLKDQDGNNLGNAIETQDTDTGATSVEVKSGDSGNVVTNMTYDALTRKITFEKGITALTEHQDISGKLDKKPDGTNDLIVNNKITNTYLPDYLLGQVLYGGTVTTGAVASLTPNAKSKLGTSSNSITLTNDTTAITGYEANEGIYYIADANFTFAGLNILTGDWLISKGTAWDKIDNTDAVTGVKGNAEVSYRIGNINITPDDLDDTSTTNKFVTASEKSTWNAKQDAIPTTSTAGKVLKSTSTAGTVEWGDAASPTVIWWED